MILQVQRLIALKQYVGTFSEVIPAPSDKLILPLAEVEGDVRVEGEYEIYDDDSVGVTLKLVYALKGRCSYCLEDARAQVSYSYEALFVTDDSDDDNYRYDGVRLDLRPAVEDAFVFSQPEVLLCADCARPED